MPGLFRAALHARSRGRSVRSLYTARYALLVRILALMLRQFAPWVRTEVRNHHGANLGVVVSIGYVSDRILLVTFFRSKLLRRHSSRNSVNCAMYSIAVSSEGFEAPIRTIEVIWSMTLQP